MKMKIVLLVVSLTIGLSMNAQFRLGVQAGYTKTSPSVQGLANPKGYAKVAPGVVIEFPLAPGFNIRPSLDYLKTQTQSTGSILVPGSGGGAPTSLPTINNIDLTNIQIPLDLCLPIKMGKKKGKLLLTAGPVLNFALEGASSTTYTLPGGTTPTTVTNPLSFGNANVNFKGIDWGTRFGVGYRTRLGFDLMANYKIAPDINNSTTVSQKNHMLSFTAAYFLVGGKK